LKVKPDLKALKAREDMKCDSKASGIGKLKLSWKTRKARTKQDMTKAHDQSEPKSDIHAA